MKVTSRFNIRVKTKIEAVALCGAFIQGSIACDELQKYAIADGSQYPVWVALEGSGTRILGGKPSGPCLEPAFVVGEFAALFYKGWMDETGKHLATMKRNVKTLGIILAGLVAMLALSTYDLFTR